MKKKIVIISVITFVVLAGLFFFYFNNTRLVSRQTRNFYAQLKDTLKKRGLSTRLLVISTKRLKFHNDIQVEIGGAARGSRHLVGDAIDFIVFDINKDGKTNSTDVNIVFDILDKDIIGNKGGIGTYKKESSFINRQMIHIDNRGYRARWAR